MMDALSTGRKLLRWGFQSDVKCIFCKHIIEDKDHLFFATCYKSSQCAKPAYLLGRLKL
jgi:hypothetical protein